MDMKKGEAKKDRPPEFKRADARGFENTTTGEISEPPKSGLSECLNYLSSFPDGYEFDKDDLLQQWMAEGFIQPFDDDDDDDDAEYTTIASSYFESICQFSRLDGLTGRPRYKLKKEAAIRGVRSFRIEDGSQFRHVPNSDLFPKRLRILLLLHEHPTPLDYVPPHLFLNLPWIRVLDLSGTNIRDLPGSIGNLKALRYLNLSTTLIMSLPDSLCSLYQMQTLKLRGCLELVDLPQGMWRLVNLRHLDLDIASLLDMMPPGLGELTRLRTLPAFIVGKHNGCHVTELKCMPNLRGSLCILRLENVSNSNEGKGAALDEKKHLDHLELQWTELQDGLELLENLRPHTNLKELQIMGYGGATFPNWIGDPLFSNLVTLSLYDCRMCEFLPPLGNLPLLKYLFITKMHAVKTIDSQFCGREMATWLVSLGRLVFQKIAHPFSDYNMLKAFPCLENFTLHGMPCLEKWTGMEEGDFYFLQKLHISGCSKLTNLPELSLFMSLQELEISLCPLLKCFPNKGLPTSLQSLLIIDCPLLKERCRKEEGEDWGKIANIPNVWVDYQQVSG